MKKDRKSLKNNCAFIMQFAMDDFKTKYAGSVLGFFWAFIQPIITVVIYWFIFQVGFKNGDVDGYPFILWLVSGLLPWFFVSDSITNAIPCFGEYSYLVKKVLFNINILPMARIVSTFFIQVFLILFTAVLFFLYGYAPAGRWLQLIYYIIVDKTVILWRTCILRHLFVCVFTTQSKLFIILQVIFWITPIVWQIGIFDERVQALLEYNPLFYVVRGYRDSFLGNKMFWQYGIGWNLYYWVIAIIFLAIGIFTFQRLKPHFADVL